MKKQEVLVETSTERQRAKWAEKFFEEVIAKIFPNIYLYM